MPEGRIIKALSGYYYVLDGQSIWQCRARGLFKKKGITPLVGDWVEYDQESNEEGYIQSVGERTTELVRPPIANVDQAVLVFSLAQPAMSHLLLDKFLVHTESAGVRSIICLSKADLAEDEIDEIEQLYQRIGYEVLVTSKYSDQGIAKLREMLQGHITVLAGQSGVGKSTLLNALFPGSNLQTGEVSERLRRGKHTTRHVELIPVEGGFVADTPGFSQLDFFEIEPVDLSYYYLEMKPYIPDCKFRGCTHLSEPKCAVREALELGMIAPSRYESYKQFIQEIKDKKRRY
ncbi:ribosome small subunit-dependent GTPase A [Ammoniphilus sp. CFH 90114]|uniref:ribosome small subunit-dependent GTPase A n=1 Tax=Ammoniphilus sp. CFH 90114 TaxID=2493665 RepID=UPI00100E6892|nr:ribosome small subunit-dependent GTPase A [Ammoniphilus sp. CFH 90114]RXT15052.1 ribosome small subunit-dependent GTPase A [Ammoniphilus sp. CFH 90114]